MITDWVFKFLLIGLKKRLENVGYKLFSSEFPMFTTELIEQLQ